MDVEAEVSVDLTEFYKEARTDIATLIGGAEVKAAVIFNNAGRDIKFYVYNYTDVVNWVPAQKTLIADGYYATVAASGVYFKIHPDNNGDAEFLVAPGKAYVFHGQGKIEEVTS